MDSRVLPPWRRWLLSLWCRLTPEARRVRASGRFDPGWYLSTYPEVGSTADEALWHWVRHGQREGRLGHPRPRGRQGSPRAVAVDPRFEAQARPASVPPRGPQVWAFFLPQFYRTPTNDQAWGPGFTEWTNVVQAGPRFPGHAQPHLPRDWGFYDLSSPGVLANLAAAARRSGLEGFCFYYYWFDGRRELERPLEALLADPGVHLPFFLLWANEPWTRAWSGLDGEVLVPQTYDPTWDSALVADWARHFQDPRYLRWQGRPVFLLYRWWTIPEFEGRLTRWRTLLKDTWGLDPWFAVTEHPSLPPPAGVEGTFDFPPQGVQGLLPDRPEDLSPFDGAFQGRYFAYETVSRWFQSRPPGPLHRLFGVFPQWDHEARRPGHGGGTWGSTPQGFGRWVERSLASSARQGKAQGPSLVLVNAWNEWAEGCHLEPDLQWGWAYLNSLSRALDRHRGPQPPLYVVVAEPLAGLGAWSFLRLWEGLDRWYEGPLAVGEPRGTNGRTLRILASSPPTPPPSRPGETLLILDDPNLPEPWAPRPEAPLDRAAVKRKWGLSPDRPCWVLVDPPGQKSTRRRREAVGRGATRLGIQLITLADDGFFRGGNPTELPPSAHLADLGVLGEGLLVLPAAPAHDRQALKDAVKHSQGLPCQGADWDSWTRALVAKLSIDT